MTHPEIPLLSAREIIPVAQLVAEHYGAEAVDNIFSKYGFSKRILNDPDMNVPNAEYVRFLEACARQTGQPFFGAVIGGELSFSELGTFGNYVTSASTIEIAMRRLSRAIKYHETGSQVALVRRGSVTKLSYRPPTPRAVGSWQQSDGALAMVIKLIRAYEGADWNPDQIRLQNAVGARREKLQAFFGVPVESRRIGFEVSCSFAAPRKAGWIGQPKETVLTLGDLRKMVKSKPPKSFDVVFKLLLHELSKDAVFELDRISQLTGIGTRTIQRRLKRAGTSFGMILQDVKLELANELLAKTDLGLSEIAKRLGYSSTPQFVRAFKDWTGVTPGSVRSLSN